MPAFCSHFGSVLGILDRDKQKNTVSILPSLLADPSGGTSSLSLDADLDGATLNQYDGLNRLVQVETGTTTATYTYRPDGLRNSKTVDGVTTTQVWDGSNLVMELTGDTVTGKYLRGVGLIAADLGGTRSYYQYNAHGDVTGLTNATGTLTQSYDYDAFGNEKTASSESDTNPFRYCGEYLDAETGSYYLRARYYEPTIGRFLTEDTVKGQTADPLSLNLYTYCKNNPIMYHDPTGNNAAILVEQFTSSPAGQQIMQQIQIWANQAGVSVQTFIANNMPAIQQLINQTGQIGPAVHDYFASGQAANDINSGIQWAGDKIKSGSDSVKNWFNKTFGGGTTPGDPNNWKNGQSARDVLNKAEHVFGDKNLAEHKLEGLLNKYSGDTVNAYKGLTDAAQKFVQKSNITSGAFEEVLKVKGYEVTIRGWVVDGMVRVSTAFIP